MSVPASGPSARQRSALTVAPDDPARGRLFPRGTLLGMALLGLAAMAVMWPERQLARLVETSTDDRLAIQYLEQLLRLRRGDVELRLHLARRYLHAGEPDAALAALEPLGAEPRADALRLGIYQRRWFDAKAAHHEADRLAAERALRALLARAAPPATYEDWRTRLTIAQALQDADLVARTAAVVQRLLPLPVANTREAVALLIGVGQYAPAAAVATGSVRAATSAAERRELLLLAARSLVASGDAGAAYETVAPLAAREPADAGLAWTMVQLALAANRAGAARDWLRQLLPADASAQTLAAVLTPERADWAWRVALASGDLALATRIADAVLATAPSEEWARRRAQVLEWNQQPEAAMRQWMALLAQHFSADALAQLGRLAKMLQSGPGQIAYFEARARAGELAAADWQQYATALELQGDARAALAVLQRGAQRYPALWARLAWLQRAIGDLDAARAAYAQADDAGALDAQAAVDYAVLLIQGGAYEAALELLTRAQSVPGAPEQRAALLGLRADLAWDLGRAADAAQAYRALWNRPELHTFIKPYQYERFLVATLDAEGAAAAQALAASLWPMMPGRTLAIQWLNAIVKAPSLEALQRWQRAVDDALGERLEQEALVRAARAQVWLALKRPLAALTDLQQAVRLDPQTLDHRVALMWLLLDLQRLDELRQQLAVAATRLKTTPDGEELLAVVYQALNDLPRALALSAQMLPRKRNDALWLINYGDLLTRANEGVRARAAYDRAWTLLQQAARSGAGTGAGLRFEQLLAAQRLAKEPHDRITSAQQQRLVAALRERLRCAASALACAERLPEQAQAQLDAAIATWLVRLDTKDAARAWLSRAVLTRADRQSIELQIALAENDRQRVDELIDAGALRALTPIDRVEALRVAGRRLDARAQAAAVFEDAADRGQHSEALEAMTRDETQRRIDIAHRTGLRFEHRLNDVVRRDGPVFEQSVTLAPQLKLSVEVARWRLQSTEPRAITGLPDHARDARLALTYDDGTRRARLSVGRNEAVGGTTPLSLELQFPLPWGIRGDLQWHKNAVSEDSAALLVAGKADRLQFGASKTLGRWWANGTFQQQRYATRAGAALGTARQFDLQGGVWLRQGEPDLGLRMGVSSRRTVADGTPEPLYARLDIDGNVPGAGFFVPAGDDTLALGLTLNTLAADRYSRHWLPWADVAWTQSRRQGAGAELNLGVQGPVVGNDRLSLAYQRRRDVAGAKQQWTLQYQIWWGP